MHIAIVIENFDPAAGGAERSTAQIAIELVERGHRVTVISGGAANLDLAPGVESIHLGDSKWGGKIGGFLYFAWWARQQLRKLPHDVSLSITNAVAANVMQPRAGLVKEALERNVAIRRDPLAKLSKRVGNTTNPKYIAQLALERRTLADPAVLRVVAVSRYVMEQLQRLYGIDLGKIELIPNAAAVPRVDAAQRQTWRRVVREAFGVSPDATAYLFVAKNARLKGFGPLVEATGLLEERGVNGVVLLAGDIWYGHHEAVVEQGLRGRMRFIRQTRNVAALYAAADVTVLPTFYDPASKVVIESLMMGTPAISTAYNGASEFIVPPPETGARPRGIVVAEPWDVAGLADAMETMADPAVRAEYAAATGGLDEELSMRRHVDRLEQVLAEAAELRASLPTAGSTESVAEPGPAEAS